jgi:hypothetical protein
VTLHNRDAYLMRYIRGMKFGKSKDGTPIDLQCEFWSTLRKLRRDACDKAIHAMRADGADGQEGIDDVFGDEVGRPSNAASRVTKRRRMSYGDLAPAYVEITLPSFEASGGTHVGEVAAKVKFETQLQSCITIECVHSNLEYIRWAVLTSIDARGSVAGRRKTSDRVSTQVKNVYYSYVRHKVYCTFTKSSGRQGYLEAHAHWYVGMPDDEVNAAVHDAAVRLKRGIQAEHGDAALSSKDAPADVPAPDQQTRSADDGLFKYFKSTPATTTDMSPDVGNALAHGDGSEIRDTGE